jgi:D-alanyl-D-alanine carboxypeptidase
MTALVALDTYFPSQILTVPSLDSVEGSSMGLFEDEKISVESLLYGLLLPSGNDAAFTLASNYPTGYEGFIKAMNSKAAELDLNNTHFVDPAGYDDANYTTAFDMARLGETVLEKSLLKKIVSTKNIQVTDNTGKIKHDLSNLNELLGFKGVDGIKTGFTEEAGGVLVTSLIHDGRRYIIVLFKSQDRFYDTRTIVESIIDSIRLITY